MAVKPYAAYDPFAWFYNRYWGHSFTEPVLPVLERLVLSKLPRRARVLDVCCGTGQLSALLAERGFRVIGVDGSRAMLEYARQNAPGASFVRADVRRFESRPRYHAAISIFDSMNHFLNLADLRAVFRNVRHSLRPEGVFFFDLNFARTYRARADNITAIVRHDHACLVRRRFSAARKLARWNLTMFRLRRGVWLRSDASILEACYTLPQVRAALTAAGFGRIEMYDAERDLNMPGNPGRRVFVVS